MFVLLFVKLFIGFHTQLRSIDSLFIALFFLFISYISVCPW